MLDLWEPHGANMAQGIGISQREAKHHDIRPTREEGENKISVLCTYNRDSRDHREHREKMLEDS